MQTILTDMLNSRVSQCANEKSTNELACSARFATSVRDCSWDVLLLRTVTSLSKLPLFLYFSQYK
eukprot:2798244-Amphidinium_carterae.2